MMGKIYIYFRDESMIETYKRLSVIKNNTDWIVVVVLVVIVVVVVVAAVM